VSESVVVEMGASSRGKMSERTRMGGGDEKRGCEVWVWVWVWVGGGGGGRSERWVRLAHVLMLQRESESLCERDFASAPREVVPVGAHCPILYHIILYRIIIIYYI
jgi:hypothetical protein